MGGAVPLHAKSIFSQERFREIYTGTVAVAIKFLFHTDFAADVGGFLLVNGNKSEFGGWVTRYRNTGEGRKCFDFPLCRKDGGNVVDSAKCTWALRRFSGVNFCSKKNVQI